MIDDEEARKAHARWIEAKGRAELFLQMHPAFPGKWFNHEFKVPEFSELQIEVGIEDRSLPEVSCPCSNTLMLYPPIYRDDGDVDVITCPVCLNWHCITWRGKKKPKGHFILPRPFKEPK